MSPEAPAAPAVFDRPALERLYLRLERPLTNVVYRWVWNREDAAEIVQDAFVRLWDMRAQVRPESVEALAYRIALNLAKNKRRWGRLRSFLGLEEDRTAAPAAGVESQLMDAERALAVRRAVDALPDKQRQVVLLCHYSGLAYREVADIVGIPEGTVGSRRNTALRALRGVLEEEHGSAR